MRENMMMLCWRAWHLRNNSIFGDGKAGINQHTEFLDSYRRTLTNIREGNQSEHTKGTKPIFEIKEIQLEKI
jgi:hypothetical protein